MPYDIWEGMRERLYRQHGELKQLHRKPENEADLRATLKAARATREKDARPAVFKVRVQKPKQSIKQQIAAGQKQIAAAPAAASTRAAHSKSAGLGD